MIGYTPIGFYYIAETVDSINEEQYLALVMPINLTAGGAFAALPDFVIAGSAQIGITASGTMLSTNRTIDGAISIATTVAMDISSVNVLNGEVPIGLSCVGTFTAVKLVDGSASLTLEASGTIASVLRLDGSIDITLSGAGTISSQATMDGIVSLTLNALGYLHNHEELESSVRGTFGVNTTTGGHFVYTNYNFNGMFRVGSDYYATSAAGLFKIVGSTDIDTPISWKATGPLSSLGTDNLKALCDLYVHCRASGDITINLNTDEAKQRDSYLIAQDDSAGLHRRRVKTHKGIRGTHWQVDVAGESETEISQASCRVNELQRSIY